MNSIVNVMPKYDHRQHVLSDWLAELDQRFQLGEVGEDTNKITWCQLLIGATGSSILSSLDEEATWEGAKEVLLTRLSIGSVRDKAWAALKNLKKGSKEIVELAGEAEKLAKRLHPRDEEAAETLAAEVQKLGHRTMEEVVAAAWRNEKILEEQTDTKMEHLVNTMQDQIRILKKDLKEANEKIAAHKAAAPPVTSLAAVPAPTAAAVQQPPPTPAPARHLYQDYSEEPPFYRPPRRQIDRRPPRCFLRGEEGHFVSNCPARPVLQRLLHQQAHSQCPRTASRANTGAAAPRGRLSLQPQRVVKLLEGSPEAKVTPVGCVVGPPITGQLNLEGIPVLGLVDTGASVTCMEFSVWWQYRAQWGPLKPFEGVVLGDHGKPLHIAGKTQHLNLQWGEARGRASFIVIIGLESPAACPHRRHPRHCHARSTGPADHSSQRRPNAGPSPHQPRSVASSRRYPR